MSMSRDQLFINADLGEGFPNDSALLPFVNQVNIACGGHAGSARLMMDTMMLGSEQGCSIGAHPGYEDPEHFGRRSLVLPKTELKDQLRRQLDRFRESIDKTGVHWHHIKPHGALYHDVERDQGVAEVFLELLNIYKVKNLFLSTRSWAGQQAKEWGIHVWEEAFLDRNYNDAGQLLPRSHPKALIEEKEKARNHFLWLRQNVPSQTYCIHGDLQSSLEILKYLHSFFPLWGLKLAKI